MNTKSNVGADGTIGLGILLLMTVAFVASETRGGPQIANSPELTRPWTNSPLLIDQVRPPRDAAIGGAIRELRVIPAYIDSRLDLEWASDEAVIDRYRSPAKSGF